MIDASTDFDNQADQNGGIQADRQADSPGGIDLDFLDSDPGVEASIGSFEFDIPDSGDGKGDGEGGEQIDPVEKYDPFAQFATADHASEVLSADIEAHGETEVENAPAGDGSAPAPVPEIADQFTPTPSDQPTPVDPLTPSSAPADPPTPAPLPSSANISCDELQVIASLNSAMDAANVGTPDSGESPKITAQRLRVSDLVLEETMLKARLKNLKKELEVQAELLQEMVSEGPRIDGDDEADGSDGSDDGTEDSSAWTTSGHGHKNHGNQQSPSSTGSEISTSRLAQLKRTGSPPDPAGDAQIEKAIKITPGALEKLNGQDVKTIRHLEAFMAEGKFVPGVTKGIGQNAIDKITDELIAYRMKHPVPNWDDFDREEREGEQKRERAAHPGVVIEVSDSLVEVQIPEVRETESQGSPEPEPTESQAATEQHESTEPPEPQAPTTAKYATPATTPDGTLADPLAYHAGKKAADSGEAVTANPYRDKPNSHMWHSWDAGWQAGFPDGF